MPRFKCNFSILTNRKVFRDLIDSSPLRKLLETVRAELSVREKSISDEDIGEGNGTDTRFTGTLDSPAVKPGTLVLSAVVVGDSTETFTDKGDGTLTSDGGGSGTINYTYGYFDITFNTPVKNAETIYADYVGFSQLVSYGLNKVYEARFINCAEGSDLDMWGETLNLPRNYTGKYPETDISYRARLVNELRDFAETLTAAGIKSRVNDVIGSDPEVIELHSLAPDWPIDWTDTSFAWTTWVPWDSLVDFLVVVPSSTDQSQLEQIAEAVSEIKFAPSRCLVVYDSGSGYYNLLKAID